MKSLIKVMLALAVCFASTFILLKSTGLVTIEKIEHWLEAAKSADPLFVFGIVVCLLFADLFVAVPTLTVIILGGYFLGPLLGAFAGVTGLMFAGVCGYLISYKYGDVLMRFLIKDEGKRVEAAGTFRKHGVLSSCFPGRSPSCLRSLPVWPE